VDDPSTCARSVARGAGDGSPEGRTTYYGILAGYDQHMNIVIEPETDVDDRVDDDLDGEFAVAIEDTTIIRGDNVVTIKA